VPRRSGSYRSCIADLQRRRGGPPRGAGAHAVESGRFPPCPRALAGGAVLLVGLLAAAGEFRHRTIFSARLTEPHTTRLLAQAHHPCRRRGRRRSRHGRRGPDFSASRSGRCCATPRRPSAPRSSGRPSWRASFQPSPTSRTWTTGCPAAQSARWPAATPRQARLYRSRPQPSCSPTPRGTAHRNRDTRPTTRNLTLVRQRVGNRRSQARALRIAGTELGQLEPIDRNQRANLWATTSKPTPAVLMRWSP